MASFMVSGSDIGIVTFEARTKVTREFIGTSKRAVARHGGEFIGCCLLRARKDGPYERNVTSRFKRSPR